MKFGFWLAASAAVASSQFASAKKSSCHQCLAKAGLVDKVLYPKQALYQERMDSYWSESAALTPYCIALPESAEDASTIMKVIVKNDCQFGIRGGGHGSFALSNSISDGITIDLGYMNKTVYDEERNLALVQPGGHWQDVYDTLSPYGVTVAGGRAGTVGVVLADGTITNANATHNADLWQAMKGSSGNLALITRIDMYPIDFVDKSNPVIWGGNLLYDESKGDAVIEALVDFNENVAKDENSSSIVYWAYLPSLGGTIVNAAIENTKAEVKPAAFDGYYAAEPSSDTTEVDRMSSVTKALGSGQPAGFQNIWFTSTFSNDAEIMKYAVEKFNKLNKDLEKLMPSNESGLNTLCMFQPITKSHAEKGVQNGGNVMGLDKYTEDGNLILFLVTWAANGAENEEAAFPLIKAYVEDVEAKAKELGTLCPWKFVNYGHLSQDVLSTIGDEALTKLQAASQTWDPAGVFQSLRQSGFKIPFQDGRKNVTLSDRRLAENGLFSSFSALTEN
ncbi:hypothetical protein G7Z17_g3228 [Cylindrodendrum hubeiense]|uniref:FAD-binding PCMH-type domain-containing protein n=1 Tax=Cylindrodendrum hubeiense TaxID=595255 RepID=A0A9P5HJC2_9HYPO|nr:hypothetical protein G7Z17_g3228 [Cylindrodendrum hubeiense]